MLKKICSSIPSILLATLSLGLFDLIHIKTSSATLIYTADPFSSVDANGLSPFWDWKTVETENFRITFPKELGEVAQKAANYLEEAHHVLSPLLSWQPASKTQILLIDNMDAANGLTSPIARFGIILWATPPDNWYGTNYYDDWLRLLIFHEYTHLLNMDTTESFWKPLRYVFGDVLLPNAVWPPWMLEGLAVYMETRFTHSGRGRSNYYDMVLRASVEDGTLDTSTFITLDKVNAIDTPYFPGGDTRYIFGYNLMNEVARSKPIYADPSLKFTEVQNPGSTHFDENLYQMSKRSGARIPYLINGNLENIIGRDWYQTWDNWVKDTQARMRTQLATIKSQPTTHFKVLLPNSHAISNEASGAAASPDGKWLAYTLASADRRSGLYLMDLETGKSKWVMDKLYGVTLKFTPDSKAIIYSRLHRYHNYYLYSDLEIYSLQDASTHWLTDGLRARDPDLSADGTTVVFTLTEKAVTGMATAPLLIKEGHYELGRITKISMPPLYDHYATPHFSANQKTIFFTSHPNGKSQEDLCEYNRETHQVSELIADGNFNRFPAVNDAGELYFVSNKTGVDNLYRYDREHQKATLVTNFTTGITFPNFGPKTEQNPEGVLYGCLFSTQGWDLAQIDLSAAHIDPKTVTVAPPPYPPADQNSNPDQHNKNYSEKDYSIFPSIWPRAWAPLLGLDATGVIIGGEVFGFDATNRHRYLFAGAYETQLQVGDVYGLYSTRVGGLSVDFSTSLLTNYVSANGANSAYARQLNGSISIDYPLIYTYSDLIPSLAFNGTRTFNYLSGPNYANASQTSTNPFFPSIDATLSYSSAEQSPLSVANEGGRSTTLGSRVYLNGDQQIWKGIFIDREYIRLAKHTTLSPSIKGVWSSQMSSSSVSSNAILQGRIPQQIIGAFAGDNFNQFSIRGYPSYDYIGRAAGVAALDLTFPIARLFRGWGTNPLFLDNLYGFGFAELSYLAIDQNNFFLPSVGGGIRLSLEALTLPFTLSGEFHQGLRTDYGGTSDVLFQIFATALNF